MTGPLAFWLVSMAAGITALPIAQRFFWRLPDAGAGLAFALGVTVAGYLYFLLRTLGVFGAGAAGAVLSIALVGLLSAWVAGSGVRPRVSAARALAGAMIAAGLFTFLFFAFVSFRSYLPAIEGTEQPMDLMYLATSMESGEYPPEDAWLAGDRASYYYFGYVQGAMLSAAADVPASAGYNLHLGFVFAAGGTAAASLATGLTRWLAGPPGKRLAPWGATASVAMLLLAGSLSTWFEWAAAHGRYNAGLYETFGLDRLLPCDQTAVIDCYSGPADRTTAWYPTEFFWWFDASRVIPDTITEFPSFSFILGDLHPHLMSIPLVVLVTALAAVTWRGREALSLASHRAQPELGAILAVIVGALAFQNAWDLVTFSALLGVAVVGRNLRALPPRRALTAAGQYLGPILGLAAVLYFPWYIDFSSQAGGLYPYVGRGTRPAHAFLQYGPLLAPALLFAVWGLVRFRGDVTRWLPYGLIAPVAPLAAWVILAAVRGELGDAVDARGSGAWVTLALLAALTAALASVTVAGARRSSAIAAVGAMATLGVLLLLGTELFFIRDVFFGSIPRFNTVFKLSYQAWVVLAVGGGAAAVAVSANRRPVAWIPFAGVPVLVLMGASLLFPLLAAPARTEGFSTETSIDGLASVARNDPDEYALTRWIAENTARGSVIIEASGRRWDTDSTGASTLVDANVDYRDGSRISARTGRPTAIGWYFHEVQWRGDSEGNRAAFDERQNLLDNAVYLAGDDPAAVLQAMADVDAEYVVVGRIELDRYPAELMPNFDEFLDRVFEAGDLRIYRLPRAEVLRTS